MKTQVKDKLVMLNTGVWQGSKSNYNAVANEIAKRWGDSEVENYKPRENCFTYKTWQAKGYSVKRGEKSIKALTYIRMGKQEGDKLEEVKSFPKFINLFYYKQVEPIRKQPAVVAPSSFIGLDIPNNA